MPNRLTWSIPQQILSNQAPTVPSIQVEIVLNGFFFFQIRETSKFEVIADYADVSTFVRYNIRRYEI